MDQVSRAMTEVDRVTQQSAMAAEELAATAEEMSSQATKLEELAAFFRIGDEDLGAGRDRDPQIQRIRRNAPQPDGAAERRPATRGPRASAGDASEEEWRPFQP